jgi:sec-independent protein translocase protein TatA
MQAGSGTMILALFNLGGGEVVLILAMVLILFCAKWLPEIARGLGEGGSEFLKATKKVSDEIDEASIDAGRSVGGIYGKPAAQALTPDNLVAELYDPAVLQKNQPTPKPRWAVIRFFAKLLGWIRRLLSV